jgi:predicted ArsR family transcriptional regulator
MSMDDAFGRRVTRLGALADPVRRALYRFVADQPGAVSRDQAAAGVDVPRHTAKFHLDRLVDEGLLVTEFRRLTGRTGPGAGRPAKLYRRSAREVAVSLPQRRYDLAGDVLADAVERSLAGTPIDAAVREAARDAGERAVEGSSPRHDASELHQVAGVLAGLGFEPRVDGDLLLKNCPFDRLAADHAQLVCGMNLAFVEAVTAGLGCTTVEPGLDPAPDRCCVRVRGRGGGRFRERGRDATS